MATKERNLRHAIFTYNTSFTSRYRATYVNPNFTRDYIHVRVWKRYYLTERYTKVSSCNQCALCREVWILRYSRKFMKLSVG